MTMHDFTRPTWGHNKARGLGMNGEESLEDIAKTIIIRFVEAEAQARKDVSQHQSNFTIPAIVEVLSEYRAALGHGSPPEPEDPHRSQS